MQSYIKGAIQDQGKNLKGRKHLNVPLRLFSVEIPASFIDNITSHRYLNNSFFGLWFGSRQAYHFFKTNINQRSHKLL